MVDLFKYMLLCARLLSTRCIYFISINDCFTIKWNVLASLSYLHLSACELCLLLDCFSKVKVQQEVYKELNLHDDCINGIYESNLNEEENLFLLNDLCTL